MDELDLGSTIRGFSPGQKVFARYTLRKILGRGGMGVVWLAKDEELERDVALKFLPEVVAMDKQAILELKRETRRSLELTHPHIIRIYDFVQDGRTAAISMEYVAGDTLAALKLDQPQHCYTAADLTKWVRQLCEALDYAHGKAQVVHRDLKPANLMIDGRGDLKIADFGIAASVSDSVSRVSNQAGSSGTPVYMSPQQMMGEKPAVTDDIYSLGATLYDLLTGKPPFHSGNILMQVQNKVPAPVSERLRDEGIERSVPPEWDQAIAACLAKEAEARPKSAREMAHLLGVTGGGTSAPFIAAPAKPAAPKPAAVTPAPVEKATAPRRLTPLFTGLAVVGLILAGGLGWYFGLHLPEQKRRQEEQVRAEAEQKRLAEERELAASIKEVEAHLAAAEWVKAEVALAAMERTGAGKPQGWSGQWAGAHGRLQVLFRQKREEARLAALRIPVTIRTSPPGAEIVLDGTPRGQSPLAGLPLPLGKHSIVARLANHDESEQTVEVTEKGQSEWTIALVRSTGKVAFQVRPDDAADSLSALDDNGRRLASAPRYSGIAGQEPLVVETGRYEVLVVPKSRVAGLEHRETVTVVRGQTVNVAADVRTGSLQITSVPAGAEVWQEGRRVGLTPLTLENLLPKKATEIELRLAGYKSAKESVWIPNADTPQEWQAELKKNAVELRADFRDWHKRVSMSLTGSVKVSSYQRDARGQTTPLPGENANIEVLSVYDLATGSDGRWTKAVATVQRQAGAGAYSLKPDSVIVFDRMGDAWSARIARGGFVETGPATDALRPSYPALWLDDSVLPSGAAEPGKEWNLPSRAATVLFSSFLLVDPAGSIRGRVAGADPAARNPWVDLEYAFDLRGGTPSSALPSSMSQWKTEASYVGTLTIRIDLGAKMVTSAEQKFRSQLKYTTSVSNAGGNEVALLAQRSAPTMVVSEIDSTARITIRPLEGESQADRVVAEVAPAKVPVYFVRRNNVMLGIAARLGADLRGEPLVRLSDGTYQMVEMAPGTYPIQVVQGVGDTMGIRVDTVIQVVPGQTNYFEIGFGMTKPQIRAQTETEGKAWVASLKPTKLMGNQSR